MYRREDLEALIRDLTPVEVLDYYDGPRFYSCRDKAGQLYLVYWVDETKENSSWLYIRISIEKYGALRRGDIPIAETLARPEDGTAFLVVSSTESFHVEPLTNNGIKAEWLPEMDDRLDLPYAGLPSNLTSPVELAQKSHRHVLDVAFEKISNTYEMGAGKLGRLLEAIQNTLFALSCDPTMDIRRVPEDIKQRSELMVTGVFASSFGVRLQTKGADIFCSDDVSKALEILTNLIDALNRPESLSEELHRLNILARSRFKHLVRVMAESQIAVKANWGSPIGKIMNARASFVIINIALQKLEAEENSSQQTVERQARLVGVDVQSDFFALVLDDGEVIKGKLSKGLASKHFEVPSFIKATIIESSIVDPITDREKWSYLLTGVEPVQ
ncbi:DUF6575 domain-containing protein [Acidovorax sp.]|uniref:DUF6575 domain-containing protein n=1 Tax=Acidovorax sp. TaxID=1872122 RepID=UPI0027BAF447|nr:DUF6575 domain-containing protein [Acidovorax sp.]